MELIPEKHSRVEAPPRYVSVPHSSQSALIPVLGHVHLQEFLITFNDNSGVLWRCSFA